MSGALSVWGELDTTIEREAQQPDPEQEHSAGSMEAEQRRLKHSDSGSRGQVRTQGAPGTSGDEDEALETPSPYRRPGTTGICAAERVGEWKEWVEWVEWEEWVDWIEWVDWVEWAEWAEWPEQAHVDPASNKLSVWGELDTTIEREAQQPDPEQEHSAGSMEAEQRRLKHSDSGSRGQVRTQGAPGTSGDEDEALETPQPEQRSQEQSSREGQIKETTENTTKEWCEGREEEVMNVEGLNDPPVTEVKHAPGCMPSIE
ncbi:hypothetical protein B0H16DRAFT_1457632 [Mycena metata]|uniref:Uncharacterized protein n=1 Tax=Mycena metata TaxID=1033252 RepID=A0AAD7J6W2_9AGAR|nr:hypothetical protein B0H16DRAFT_1457632 [Mycena metata]